MRTRPFTVAELRDAGLPRSRLRHPALHLPTRSVRSTEPVVTVD
jgi:ribosomal protein L13E